MREEPLVNSSRDEKRKDVPLWQGGGEEGGDVLYVTPDLSYYWEGARE